MIRPPDEKEVTPKTSDTPADIADMWLACRYQGGKMPHFSLLHSTAGSLSFLGIDGATEIEPHRAPGIPR